MIPNFIPPGFSSHHTLCTAPQNNDLIFSFTDNNLLLLKSGQLPRWQDLKILLSKEHFELYDFGQINQDRCLLLDPLPENLLFHESFTSEHIRQCYKTLNEDLFRIAGLARQLHHWRSTHIFCGHCGTRMEDKTNERAKYCPQCQLIAYPQLYPCIIVLVTRGEELLLAHSPHFQPGIYSTLAGFIEPGESAEDAVHREVREEVKIEVKNVRYIMSQPWPFPNSLMLGYMAEYEGGEIGIDALEIEDAQWFKPDALPKLPMAQSISRLLVDRHLESLNKGS